MSTITMATRMLRGALPLASLLCCGVPVVMQAQGSALAQVSLAPRSQRLSDEVITRDLQQLARAEMAAGQAGDQRGAAFAMLARDAYERNDEGSLSALMLQAGAGRTQLPRTTRGDLWLALDSARAASGAGDAAADITALEVALVRAQYPLLGAPSCAAWEREAERLAQALRSRRPAPVIAVVPPPAVVTPTPVPEPVVTPAPTVRLDSLTPTELRGVPSMVHFALDRHDLSPASRNVLAALVDSLRYFPTVKIVLEGHTDLRASVEYNLALSRRRTLSVQGYLQLLGIDSARISIVAQGKSQLVKTGTDALSHARNRRVQLRYFKEDGSELQATQLLDDLQLEVPRMRRARPARR